LDKITYVKDVEDDVKKIHSFPDIERIPMEVDYECFRCRRAFEIGARDLIVSGVWNAR
jgi:delta-aminolevulinic acid dehydratase/porphobilinogen synthase